MVLELCSRTKHGDLKCLQVSSRVRLVLYPLNCMAPVIQNDSETITGQVSLDRAFLHTETGASVSVRSMRLTHALGSHLSLRLACLDAVFRSVAHSLTPSLPAVSPSSLSPLHTHPLPPCSSYIPSPHPLLRNFQKNLGLERCLGNETSCYTISGIRAWIPALDNNPGILHRLMTVMLCVFACLFLFCKGVGR